MALIVCPECKKEVSDRAGICPNCGYPLEPKNEAEQEKKSKRPWWLDCRQWSWWDWLSTVILGIAALYGLFRLLARAI